MSRDGESHSLVIKNVTEEDKGEYRIEAGPAKSTANLEVKGESRNSPQQARAPVSESRKLPSPKIEIKEEYKATPPKNTNNQEGKMHIFGIKNIHQNLEHRIIASIMEFSFVENIFQCQHFKNLRKSKSS